MFACWSLHRVCWFLFAAVVLVGAPVGTAQPLGPSLDAGTMPAAASVAGGSGACCSPQAPHPCRVTSESSCRADGGYYGGDGSACATTDCDRCDDPFCEFCWIGTGEEGTCDAAWEGDGSCDCGCRFDDAADCTGACCFSVDPFDCLEGVGGLLCMENGQVYLGNRTVCTGSDCDLCDDPLCYWCWVGTVFDGICDPDWRVDDFCDCGCQFLDLGCGSCGDGQCQDVTGENACTCGDDCETTCGDLCCREDENRRACSADCYSLAQAAEFFRCFTGAGISPSPPCAGHDFDGDADIDAADYRALASDRLGGP